MSNRRTLYQHSSGFQKRKIAQKKSANAQELISKILKLTVNFRKQQCEPDTGVTESTGAETSDVEISVRDVPHR